MKKILLSALLGAAAVLGANAELKVTVTPLGDKPVSPKKEVSVSMADVIVNEDFELFDGGTNDEPEWDNRLASHYHSELIDPELTHGAQWRGHNVCMAGGSAGLYNINPQDPAYIRTPKMDYSGTITLTFLCKALYTEWEEEDENGEMKKWHFTSTAMMVSGRTDDYYRLFDLGPGNEDYATNFITKPIYPNQGWCEVKIVFDNYAAYNDACIEIASAGHLLIDDMRVTASCDKFIGSPVFEGYTAATDDSVTVSWQPVRKSYNYYLYLYELDGYDENGEPIYKLAYKPEDFLYEEDLKMIEEMGITAEEYLTELAEQYGMTYEELIEMSLPDIESPYSNLGRSVDHKEGTPLYTYTYTGLDPEKQYYFDIRSHYQHTFSPRNVRPMNVIGTPENLAATDITDNGFTANWGKIAKADRYTVDLYGVDKVEEDTEGFVIFEEDFDKTNDLTDATDISNPDAVGEGSDITFDDLTSSPGWVFGDDDYILLVKGKVGLGVDDYGCFRLTSPRMYVAGADEATISMRVESVLEGYELRIRFADVVYSLPVEGSVFEGEFIVPTLGQKETTFAISGPDEAPIFIDYFSVSQNLKKGAYAYTWFGRIDADKETFSYDFSDLDNERYSRYAYAATAYSGEEDNMLTSLPGNRMIVDLVAKNSELLAEDIHAVRDVTEVARYTIDGRQVSEPVKGINIIRYSDGSTRKVFVK